MSAYRHLVRLYPKAFRDEFADDLVALFEDQRADDGALRTWSRTARDLLVSIPTQHLEVIVRRPSPRAVAAAVTVAGVAILLVGVVLGSVVSPLLLAVGASVAVGGAVAWQQHRDVAAPTLADSWWKVLLAGPALLATTIVLHGVWPRSLDLDADLAWLLTFSSVMLSIALVVCGAMLGAVSLAARRQASR